MDWSKLVCVIQTHVTSRSSLKRCNDDMHIYHQSHLRIINVDSKTTHTRSNSPMNFTLINALPKRTFTLTLSLLNLVSKPPSIRSLHSHQPRLAAYNMPNAPKITSVDALPANEAKWLEFQKITWYATLDYKVSWLLETCLLPFY